ncbi:hypothetical protein C627_13380 [Corynebacterium glutamicum ZL-6]|uniref:hypothetical protein n=1 Tax=Corynebacterium TaxID=1716 RepID=UPI0008074D42|nr:MULTISPECIES: hypothetical protein [Corynebacterium]ANR63593.1 hypothetical protein C628_13510 [[Brevibacterium] flavum ZL-1]ANR66600.1 hypothetical protein C627_13380 [Corynebacterium glutamicum ZL-6]PST74493.1 hypothetical protein I919_13559 [Corynebacterium glutamicum ZL-2]
MSQGFTQPPGGTFGSSSGGFSGGQSGFGGGSQNSGFGGSSGGFSGGSSNGSFGGSTGGFTPAGSTSNPSGFSTPKAAESPAPGRSSGRKRAGGRLQSAPTEWILPGLVLGLISLGLNAWITFGAPVATDNLFLIVAGIAWVLAGILSVLSIGKYMSAVNERKSTGFYTEVPWKKALFTATVVLLVFAVVWSALDIALWVGKQSW